MFLRKPCFMLAMKSESGGAGAGRTIEAPKFTKSLSGLEVADGSKAVFEVCVRAQPTPDVVWFHQGHPLQQNLDYQVSLLCFFAVCNH